jgi:hypothetical protein
VKSQSRAVFVATGVLATWALLPLLTQEALFEVGIRWRFPWVAFLSPMAAVRYAHGAMAQRSAGGVPGGMGAMLASFLSLAGLTLLLRWFTYWSARRCLGRVEGPPRQEEARSAILPCRRLKEKTHD